MKINVILPFLNKTGGIAVLLEHAHGLAELGHDLAVYYPLLPYRQFLAEGTHPLRKYLVGQLKPFIGNAIRSHRRAPWFSKTLDVAPVPWISDRFIRDADVSIASAWPTAYSVAALRPSKGRKYYFVQHYETWDSDLALVDQSYRLPLEIITIAPWLTELMAEKFSRKVAGEIHNGIDLDRFHPPPSRDWSKPSLLMLHHALEWKGIADGLRILEEVHASHPDVMIRMFGMYPFPQAPDYIEFHQNPSAEKLLGLYQASTLFVSPSHKEGWHLPPMEAMACGCAVVATAVGCIPVLHEGDNMRVAEPKDVPTMVRHLNSLIEDPEGCRMVAEKGRVTISRYGWPTATAKLLAAIS